MKYAICLLILINAVIIKSDIPTHCLKSQVIGKWNFELSNPSPKSLSELYQHTCGHKLPSNEKTSHLVVIKPEDYPYKNVTISLLNDNQATWGSKVIINNIDW
jgi:hypothetical protein